MLGLCYALSLRIQVCGATLCCERVSPNTRIIWLLRQFSRWIYHANRVPAEASACAIRFSCLLWDGTADGQRKVDRKAAVQKCRNKMIVDPYIPSDKNAFCLYHRMELNLQLPADVTARRRLQNRNAQRRFRRKSSLSLVHM